MALQDLQSQYGPYNKKGAKGTGEVFDTFAREDATGLAAGGSKYQTSEKMTWGYPLGGNKLELAAKIAQDASKSGFQEALEAS